MPTSLPAELVIKPMDGLRCRHDTARSTGLLWGPGPLPLPLRCSHLPRRISAGSIHPCLVPAMAQAYLIIDIDRAGAEGNQELFRRTLEALISG